MAWLKNVGNTLVNADIFCRHAFQHLQNVRLDSLDIGFDLSERARRLIPIEIAVEVDLVADQADLPVPVIALRRVDPSIGNMRLDLALKKGADAGRYPVVVHGILSFGKRHALGVAQLWVGFRRTVLVATDLGRLIALGEGVENCFFHWCWQFEFSLPGCFRKLLEECFPVLVKGVGHHLEHGQNSLLQSSPLGLFLGTGLSSLLRFSQILKACLFAEALDPFRARLEIEPQRSFNGDLAIPKLRRREDAADDALLVLAVV